MDNINERVEFSYSFHDSDDGSTHFVRSSKERDSIRADELCEMFLDFMKSAGYSEDNVFDYFSED